MTYYIKNRMVGMKRAGWFLIMMVFMNAASAAAPERQIILALGDSTTAGTPGFRSPLEDPPNGSGDEKSQYAYWMMRQHPEWTVLNRGIAGQRTDQIWKRFKKYVETEKPHTVIVLAGVNDLYQGYSEKEVEANLEKIYMLAVEKKIRVVACTILPYNRASPAAVIKILRVNSWIREISKKNEFIFCDTFRAVSNPLGFGLAGSPDRIHPDVEGYRKMAEALAQALSPEA